MMNAAHLHLLVNHIPILGTVFGVLLLLVAAVRRSAEIRRVGLAVFVLAAAAAVPTYLTGEPAEEVVEHLAGVSEAVIESHEEAAELASVALGILGLLSLVGIVLFRRSNAIPGWFGATCLALSLVVIVLMTRTANLGGQIRHSEIRPQASAAGAGDSESQRQPAE